MIKCYSAIKRNVLLIHGTMWINSKSITLGEEHQTQDTNHGPVSMKFWKRPDHGG